MRDINMKLLIEIKNIYGNQNAYPACDKSELLCELTGKKTFSLADFDKLKKLGYSIGFKASSFARTN